MEYVISFDAAASSPSVPEPRLFTRPELSHTPALARMRRTAGILFGVATHALFAFTRKERAEVNVIADQVDDQDSQEGEPEGADRPIPERRNERFAMTLHLIAHQTAP